MTFWQLLEKVQTQLNLEAVKIFGNLNLMYDLYDMWKSGQHVDVILDYVARFLDDEVK